MKNRTARIISGTLEPVADWISRKPLLTLVLALLLIKSYPKLALVLFLVAGIAVYRSAQQPAHLVIEVDPV